MQFVGLLPFCFMFRPQSSHASPAAFIVRQKEYTPFSHIPVVAFGTIRGLHVWHLVLLKGSGMAQLSIKRGLRSVQTPPVMYLPPSHMAHWSAVLSYSWQIMVWGEQPVALMNSARVLQAVHTSAVPLFSVHWASTEKVLTVQVVLSGMKWLASHSIQVWAPLTKSKTLQFVIVVASHVPSSFKTNPLLHVRQ